VRVSGSQDIAVAHYRHSGPLAHPGDVVPPGAPLEFLVLPARVDGHGLDALRPQHPAEIRQAGGVFRPAQADLGAQVSAERPPHGRHDGAGPVRVAHQGDALALGDEPRRSAAHVQVHPGHSPRLEQGGGAAHQLGVAADDLVDEPRLGRILDEKHRPVRRLADQPAGGEHLREKDVAAAEASEHHPEGGVAQFRHGRQHEGAVIGVSERRRGWHFWVRAGIG